MTLQKHVIADVAKALTCGFTLRACHDVGGGDQDAENDGGVFLAEVGFDDQSAKLDFITGILLVCLHGDATEAPLKPFQEMTQMAQAIEMTRMRGAAQVIFSARPEIAGRWPGTPSSACYH